MTSGDIDKDFKSYIFNSDQIGKSDALRAEGKLLALLIYNSCPSSAEMTTAIRKVEEAVFWANAAIARHSD